MDDDTFMELLSIQDGIAEIADTLPDNLSKLQIATMFMAMQNNGIAVALECAAPSEMPHRVMLSCAVAAKSLSEALVDQASIRE